MKREVRSKSVGTKVSEAELRVLESRAERAGLTLSEWVCDVLLGIDILEEIFPEILEPFPVMPNKFPVPNLWKMPEVFAETAACGLSAQQK